DYYIVFFKSSSTRNDEGPPYPTPAPSTIFGFSFGTLVFISVPIPMKSDAVALMATSNSPTFGQSNSPRQDG
ncbi:hypothetical protein, partial [Rhodoferax sp.]|uniref:hypothetical protein n=1 Tax=Rhodoferax sp. TaxID=50421 RepID=UPI0025D205B9